MLTYLGSLTIGAVIPLFVTVELAITAAFGPLLAELNAKLAGYLALAIKIGIKPPSLFASIDLAANIAASLNAALAAGFTPPSIDFSVTAIGLLVAELQIKLGLLNAAFNLALQLGSLNAAAGVHAFVYEGPISGLPSAMGSVSGSTGLAPGTIVYAPIFMADASVSATKTALKTVFVHT